MGLSGCRNSSWNQVYDCELGRRHLGPKLLGTPVVWYKLRVPVWERKDE